MIWLAGLTMPPTPAMRQTACELRDDIYRSPLGPNTRSTGVPILAAAGLHMPVKPPPNPAMVVMPVL